MFKFILLGLLFQRAFSTDEQTVSLSEHPLFTKIFRLLDQLLLQVRKMQTLISRTYEMMDQIPADLRPFFATCIPETHNVSRIQYSLKLNEAEVTRIPQIKAELKQATTVDQQLHIMNLTDRTVADITLNVLAPSLSLVTEIVDCLKSKSLMTKM